MILLNLLRIYTVTFVKDLLQNKLHHYRQNAVGTQAACSKEWMARHDRERCTEWKGP